MSIDDKNGKKQPFNLAYRGQSTSHIIYKPKKIATYRFVVRATNIYG